MEEILTGIFGTPAAQKQASDSIFNLVNGTINTLVGDQYTREQADAQERQIANQQTMSVLQTQNNNNLFYFLGGTAILLGIVVYSTRK